MAWHRQAISLTRLVDPQCLFFYFCFLSTITIGSIYFLPVGSSHSDNGIAFSEVHQDDALSGASELPNVVDILANNDAGGRDNHQVVVVLCDEACGGNGSSFIGDFGGD